jgi:hypothetical protein
MESAVVVPAVTPTTPPSEPPVTVASPVVHEDPLPAFASSIQASDGFTIDPDVLLTNLFLTGLVILIFGLTSAVFNSTIDDNRDDIAEAIHAGAKKLWFVSVPILALNRVARSTTERARLSTPARVAVILAVTGLIYGFLSPDFGFNLKSLLLFVALVIGLGFGTYLQEGGSALLAIRRYHVDSSVRLFGAGIVVAIVCVALSRLAGLQPGFVYGFIASSVILSPIALDRRASANLVIWPSVALLVASIGAWLVLGPIHQAALLDGSWFNVLADTVAASIFIGGLEGVFYSMIPITFMDGAVVWRWNRLAWLVIFGTATFLFWQLVINQYAAYLDAFRQPTILAILLILLVYGTLTIATWAFFRYHRSRRAARAADASAEAPAAGAPGPA